MVAASRFGVGELEGDRSGKIQAEVLHAVTVRRARAGGPHALHLAAGRVLNPGRRPPHSLLLPGIADGRFGADRGPAWGGGRCEQSQSILAGRWAAAAPAQEVVVGDPGSQLSARFSFLQVGPALENW